MILSVAEQTKQILVGDVPVGGGAPVSIQTMAKAPPDQVDRIVDQLKDAKKAGCDIARIAIPNLEAVKTIGEIKQRSGLPIVADIHFDYRLAVAAARNGADGLRVNPGNLGGRDALKAVVTAAAEADIPIRVGVNAGSLPKTQGMPAIPTADAMVNTALKMIADIESIGFDKLKVSLKAFDLFTTVEANRRFTIQADWPLHLGVTEAGPSLSGTVRSAAALGILLAEGIGDTIRISLSSDPAEEVRVARYLLRTLNLRPGPVVVSCPTCGRTDSQVVGLATKIESTLELLNLDLVVAVMGCEVNGPGEAREADLGVAFGPQGQGLLFESGQIVGKYANEELHDVLLARLKEIKEEIQHE